MSPTSYRTAPPRVTVRTRHFSTGARVPDSCGMSRQRTTAVVNSRVSPLRRKPQRPDRHRLEMRKADRQGRSRSTIRAGSPSCSCLLADVARRFVRKPRRRRPRATACRQEMPIVPPTIPIASSISRGCALSRAIPARARQFCARAANMMAAHAHAQLLHRDAGRRAGAGNPTHGEDGPITSTPTRTITRATSSSRRPTCSSSWKAASSSRTDKEVRWRPKG